MNLLDAVVRTYAGLHDRHGHIPVRALTPLRVLMRYGARWLLPRYLARQRRTQVTEKTGVVVSFTSFPVRINIAWQVVECMLRQTFVPRKVILWLSKEQFPTYDDLPSSLRERVGEHFEIRMVEGDLRSHKKYYYVAKEYPDSLVFLVDDDIYYDSHLLERSVKAHQEFPDAVICNYGYHIGYNKDSTLKPYKQWKHEYYASTDDDLFFGSGGGTLFCPSDLYSDLTDIEHAMKLCPIADDVWLNAMAKLAKRRTIMLKNGPVLPIYCPNDVKLATQNLWDSGNDEHLAAVLNYYKEKDES